MIGDEIDMPPHLTPERIKMMMQTIECLDHMAGDLYTEDISKREGHKDPGSETEMQELNNHVTQTWPGYVALLSGFGYAPLSTLAVNMMSACNRKDLVEIAISVKLPRKE